MLGMSTDSARALVGSALELAHRLPRTWKQMRAGEVPVWKGRRLAQLTLDLPVEGAEFVDRQLAGTIGKVGWAMIERLVDHARAVFDPEGAEKQRREAADGRRFDVHTRETAHDGTVRVEGELDLADALDLDAAIRQGARNSWHSARPSRSTCAVRRPPVSSPGVSWPSTCGQRPARARCRWSSRVRS